MIFEDSNDYVFSRKNLIARLSPVVECSSPNGEVGED